jgi:transcriptional regulator with XRE-family HTH domain
VLITIPQIKAARGLLDWTQEDLANRAGLHVDQVRKFEIGKAQKIGILDAIYKAFTAQGLDFVDGGVVQRKYEIRTLHGQAGFWEFYDDVYETVREHGGDIFVHNVDESLFVKWLGERDALYDERMGGLSNFKQKIIIREGDTNFAASFGTTEYRWAAKGEFHSSTPFYLYGKKLAMIMFDPNDVSIFIIDQPRIAESYRTLFLSSWERAAVPSR